MFVAAPTPVSTPQPMSAAISSGMSSGIFTAPMAGTTATSENVPEHAICTQRLAVLGEPRRAVEQAAGGHGRRAGLAQEALALLAEEALAALRHPGDDDVVARLQVGDALADLLDDAGALVAEHHRVGAEERAVLTDRSEWQTPEAPILTLTSPALGASRSISSIVSGSFAPLATAAFGIRAPLVLTRVRCDGSSWRVARPAGQSVLALGGLHRVAEHDGGGEDDRAHEQAATITVVSAPENPHDGTDDEQHDGDAEQAVADPLAELDEAGDAPAPRENRVVVGGGHGPRTVPALSRA